MLGVTLRDALRGNKAFGELAMAAMGALFFTVAGFGMIAALLAGRRSLAREERQRQRYPSKPWMWRHDWASGRIQSAGRPTMIQAWTFALLWNLCSTPLLIMVLRGSVERGLPTIVALLFPVAGAGLLIWAVRATLRYRRFGRSVFEMTQVPVPLGGRLSGRISTRLDRAPDAGVLLKLSNICRSVRSSGDGDSISESILWREEHTVPAGLIEPGMEGWTIPVAFQIPTDAVESTAVTQREGHLWRLDAEADVPGTNFREQFEVPVFGRVAADTAVNAGIDEPAALRSTAPTAPSRLTIAVRRAGIGGTEFHFAAARNPNYARGVTAIFLFWSGVLAALLFFGAPLIVPLIWGACDLLILAGLLESWFASSRLTIAGNEAKTESSLLGFGRSRRVPLTDIARVEMPITMQANDTPYYAIELILRDGRKITAGRGIRDKREAEWLVAEIRSLLRL